MSRVGVLVLGPAGVGKVSHLFPPFCLYIVLLVAKIPKAYPHEKKKKESVANKDCLYLEYILQFADFIYAKYWPTSAHC